MGRRVTGGEFGLYLGLLWLWARAAKVTRTARPLTFPAVPLPDISGIPAYHRIDDHEGFSLHEGFSFNKRKILRDHGGPSCLAGQ
jgi:hypothetical protein